MSQYFEVITDREVLIVKSPSADSVEQWMSLQNNLRREQYALVQMQSADLEYLDEDRCPIIELLETGSNGFSMPVDGDEESLLRLAEEFLRLHATDFPSSILFYPPNAKSWKD